MDTFGIILIVIFGVLFFLTRKKPELKGWNQVSLLGIGFGAGFIAAAIYVNIVLADFINAFT